MEPVSYQSYVDSCTPSDSSVPDLDFYQISIGVKLYFFREDTVTPFLQTLCGEMVTLSSASKKRRGAERELPSNHLILTCHPVLISTILRPGLKKDFLKKATEMGYPSYPDDCDTFLVLGTRPLPVIILRQLFSSCNIRTITITNYGMKVPFPDAAVVLNSSFIQQHPPEPGYPKNSFDISFTCRSSSLYSIRLRSHPHIDRYNLFTPLDFRPAPAFNTGGSFKYDLRHDADPPTSSLVSLSIYSPLHHHVNQSGPLKTPVTFSTGLDRLQHIATLHQHFLSIDDHLLGGLRHEVRVEATTPGEALSLVRDEKPWLISNLLPDIFSISVADYKDLLPQLLHAAREELYRLGFRFAHRPLPPQAASTITAPMRLIFGDLRRLLGERTYSAYCTDPIEPNSWWRQWFHNNGPLPGFIPVPDIILPPAADLQIPVTPLPPTSDLVFLDFLQSSVLQALSLGQIRYPVLMQILETRYPGLLQKQVANRIKLLKRSDRLHY